ncbi:amidohydrolase family protein [uncultured Pseudacidovorax sp.]|uniref:amidohydrolase family protein n=2 Tax=Pseudomonadota TaxID=1224 RepID=UPI0025D3EB7F|nr:amidohydrolase family protein [uncultured Pseudacidovorax sp.]
MHVYDARFPAVAGARLLPPDAYIDAYLALRDTLGLSRTVCITPSTYGTDNRCMLEALAALGPHGRGVAVVDERVSDAELASLHARGVRGIRLNLSLGVSARPDMLMPLAQRIVDMDWHIQFIAPPSLLHDLTPVLDRLPVPFVLDHFAKLRPSALGGDVHRQVLRWLRDGRAWVKLSGAYLVTEAPEQQSDDCAALARSFLEAAPSQIVWGTNWPHATASAGHHPWPDDQALLDRLAHWCSEPAVLGAVLVDNPARLYGFGT